MNTLRELIAIKSVAETGSEEAPFGEGVQEAFDYMLKLAASHGFDTDTAGNFGGHIEFGGYTTDESGEIIGTSQEVLGILCHLDVVPEGSGWSCDPYQGMVSDGKIYGRGAIDDKGPGIACYYAMKALKDAGFVPERKVRLILGLDEETEWLGMERYLERFKAPDLGFTPDADFPVINGEMGILIFALAKKLRKPSGKGLLLRRLSGGNAPNMTPDYARAVVRGDNYDAIKTKAAAYRKETGYEIHIKGVGKSLEITSRGISAHGARPERGLNAISILLDFLSRLIFAGEGVREFLDFFSSHIGFELDGASMGCGVSDEVSGPLIFNLGMISGDDKAVKLTINIRYPVSFDKEDIYKAMLPVIDEYDMGLIKLTHKAPIYFPEDSPLIKTLMEIYRKHTGDYESRPKVIGGGTYARAAQNLAAFGAEIPGEENVAHQKDEYIKIDHFHKLISIYADAIYKLSFEDN
ncbi:dipeptidase PepV [Clostridia bacterium]|nr:dipeptidase PepV [Clostridia bacterium]